MTVRNVSKTFSLEEQRLEINEIAADLAALSSTSAGLDSFSVTTTAVGNSSLSYDSLTGEFTYTPPNLTGYLTTTSPAGGITSQNISNWDAAYNWGDHSSAGYLVNGTLSSTVYRAGAEFKLIAGGSSTTRPYIHLKNSTTLDLEIVGAQSDSGGVTIDSRGPGTVKLKDGGSLRLETSNTGVTISGVLTATGGNSDDWNSAYGWGDHSTAGYLTSYTETDPVFSASDAAGITSTDIGNWNASYGWGDHSAAGYLTSYTETDPVFSASAASGITSQNITNWNTAYGWGDHSTQGYLTSYTETDPLFAASPAFDILSGDITNWDTAYGWGDHSTEGYLTTVALNDVSDVTIATPSSGEVLTYNGSGWVNSAPTGGGGGLTFLGTPHTGTTYTFQVSEANSISGTITDQLREYVLPLGSSLQVGDQFKIFDVGDGILSSGNAANFPITITPNSSNRIQGAGLGDSLILQESGGSVCLVWMGSTYQWRILK